MYDADAHYLLMQRQSARRRLVAPPKSMPSDPQADEPIAPEMVGKSKSKQPTRLDRILRPYGGTGPGARNEEPRSYEPEVV